MSNINSFQLLENTEKTISGLKNTRTQIFSIKNQHFSWSQTYSIKDLRNFKEVQDKININEKQLKTIVNNFKKWSKIPTYLLFKEIKTGSLRCALASKRGNKIYEYYLNESLNNQLEFMKDKNFHKRILRNKKGFRNKKVSNVCFITLTCDTKKYNNNLVIAWLNFEKEYNIFTTRLRKKFGKCWIMKSIESTEKGFPHAHILLITEKEFDVFKPTRRKCKECGERFITTSKNHFIICPHCNLSNPHPYRMSDKKAIEGYWNHIFDIVIPDTTQMENQEEDCRDFMKDYIFKDMLKAYTYKIERSYRNNLSLAMGWLFGKRCFSISDERNLKPDLITDTSITQTQIKEIMKDDRYVFLGLVDFKFFNHKPPPISFEIETNNAIYEDCLNEVYGKRVKPILQTNQEPEIKRTWFEWEEINREKNFRREQELRNLELKKSIVPKQFFRNNISDPIPQIKPPPDLKDLKTQNVLDMEVILKSGKSLYEFNQDQKRMKRLFDLRCKRKITLSFEDKIKLAITGVC